ncbi:MAG TPA: alpha/beta fold hydrolase [Thermoanaerobaculia bacterium]|nr:alpha/beta fold hydrolase [Thermoanaerobaculia bacterium]
MRRGLILGVLAAVVAVVYFRPLAVYVTGRALYLRAIGMRHEHVQVGPHRIHYLEGGEGPPLLIVHGVAARAADGAPLFRRLKQRHRVIAVDLLGYGDSDKPRDGDYSVAAQTELVRRFMDALQLRDADVMGVSLGGWISLKLAADHPERVRRLVLVSSAGLQFPTTMTDSAFSPSNLGELRHSLAMQTDQAERLPEFVLRDFLRLSKRKAWVVRRSMASALAGRDLLDGKLQRVKMPVLLIWGTADRVIPFSVAAGMKHEMRHAQVVPLPGCGHLAIIECRDQALPAIERFLR